MSQKKLALTFEEWKSRGRGVHSGSTPFHWIDGKPLFREEDTYSIRWKRYWDFVERTAKEVDAWPEWKKKVARSSYAAPTFMDPPAGMDLIPTRELMERNKVNILADDVGSIGDYLDSVLFKHHPDFGADHWGSNEEDYF